MPEIMVTASFGVEPKKIIEYKSAVEKAIALSGHKDKVRKCIFFNRPELDKVDLGTGQFYVDWVDALNQGQPHDAVPVESEHPLYILHTSGTTGDPKGVVRDNGGYSVALKFVADYVYDIRPGDIWWACSEFGWVVGHSYCAYTPLLQRATSIIYEGKPVGTPNAAQLFRVACENKLCGWFLTPSAIRAIRNEDPNLTQSEQYRFGDPGLKHLRNIFIAGEHCDISTIKWLESGIPPNVRITDTWWQTETGWPITSSCFNLKGGHMYNRGVATPLGSAGQPVPGFSIHLTDQVEGNTSSQAIDINNSNGNSHDEVNLQRILVELPLPPGCASTLWKAEKRFQELYFTKYPGYYDTMDLGYMDKDNYLYIMSRADDVINVSGHRLSTSALEEACLSVDAVVDCAVIAIPHEIKGHLPFGVLVINRNLGKTEEQVLKEVFKSVRKQVGPVASFNQACIVPKLPKTRSGKISRASLADMAAGKPVKVPVTIEDISVYGPINEAFKKCGLKPSNVIS